MAKRILTVTLSNGTTATRESQRPYTHAVCVVLTEAEKSAAIAKLDAEIVRLEADIAALVPLVADPAAQAEYAAAIEADRYLEEQVDDTTLWGEQRKVARWLSLSWRLEQGEKVVPCDYSKHGTKLEGKQGLTIRHAVTERLHKCPGKQLEGKQLELASAVRARANQVAREVGEIDVPSWSQSAKGAEKLAGDVRKYRPLAAIEISTNITVKESKPRAKKG